MSKKKSRFAMLRHSNVPLIAYGALLVAGLLLWWYRSINEDFALDLLSELIGIAFIVVILDTILVRAKVKRWKMVQEQVDYLIARTVNRLRDGICTRIFSFEPVIDKLISASESEAAIRVERTNFLLRLENADDALLRSTIAVAEAMSESTYDYLNEKAADVWDIINMKYSEFLEPELISQLMMLHTVLKDACSHIRQYRKSDRFQTDKDYYKDAGLEGLRACISEMIRLLNDLKESGYSRQAENDYAEFYS